MWSDRVAPPSVLALLAVLWLPVPGGAVDEEECLRCHGLEGFLSRQGSAAKSLVVSARSFDSSVHGLLTCRECHSDVSAIPHPDAIARISCGQVCHQRDQSGKHYSHESLFWEYTTSAHGKAREPEMPCMTCHPASSLAGFSPRNLVREADQCAACHLVSGHVDGYYASLHYAALSRGDRRAPSCPDCHTAHRVLGPGDPESTVHPGRLARTCGSGALPGTGAGRCHGELPEKVMAGAGMGSLPLAGLGAGPRAWLPAIPGWILLAGLAARVLVGLVRKR